MIGPVARCAPDISILHGDDMELATRDPATRQLHRGGSVRADPARLRSELNGASPGLLHGLGIALVLSRIAHPIGLQHDNVRHPLRAIGAGRHRSLVTLIAALMLIWGFLSR